jgi:hypothetical protein
MLYYTHHSTCFAAVKPKSSPPLYHQRQYHILPMSEMAYYTGNPTANALRRIVAVLAVTLSVPSITSYHSINLNIDRNLDTLCQQLLLC